MATTEEDWVKVNIDGTYSLTANKSACGGLFQDSIGKFLKGFLYHIEDGDELSAEI